MLHIHISCIYIYIQYLFLFCNHERASKRRPCLEALFPAQDRLPRDEDT